MLRFRFWSRRTGLLFGLSFGAMITQAHLAPGLSEAANPIKVGFSAQLTGAFASNGRSALLALQIWQEDINRSGGLLGRPVELVYYDDQSNPGLVPAIYTKLISLDRVSLLLAQNTNITAAAMPVVISNQMTIVASFGLEVNKQFGYSRFFQIMPYGPEGQTSLSLGFFETALTMDEKPRTVALAGADTEFSKAALDGARTNAARLGLRIVYDRSYPLTTVDFGPVIRGIKSAGPDLIYFASYPIDSAGLLRAAREVGLTAKMMGGGMVGLQSGSIKQQFGEALNGLVSYELFVREPTVRFPGIDEFLEKYRPRAAETGVDRLGYYIPPFTYAAAELLGQAVKAVGSLDQDKIARYLRTGTHRTIIGTFQFGPDGEWLVPRILTIQYQDIRGNDLDQFARQGRQVILHPLELKSGTLRRYLRSEP
jgi:branched-chain amino acid transport system substrate-binding protein